MPPLTRADLRTVSASRWIRVFGTHALICRWFHFIDTPMEVDPCAVPSTVTQVDVLGLAAQLQRVFSRPPALDEGHPTTFADFATWLEARNVNLVCASS